MESTGFSETYSVFINVLGVAVECTLYSSLSRDVVSPPSLELCRAWVDQSLSNQVRPQIWPCWGRRSGQRPPLTSQITLWSHGCEEMLKKTSKSVNLSHTLSALTYILRVNYNIKWEFKITSDVCQLQHITHWILHFNANTSICSSEV